MALRTLCCLLAFSLAAPSSHAGAISAKIVRGSLVVKGSSLTDTVTIDQVGLGANQVRLDAGSDSTVNGLATPVVLSGFTKDLVLDMGADSENVFVKDMSVPRDVRANLGDGGNYLELNDVEVGRDVRYRDGSGSCLVILQNTTHVGRNLRADMGRGSGRLNLTSTTVVAKNVTMRTSGPMDDGFTVNASSIHGKTNLSLGDGPNIVDLDDADLDRGLRLRCGDGADVVNVTLSICIAGALVLDLGPDFNDVDIDVAGIDGGFSYRGGSGDDDVNVKNASFGGSVRCSAGDGDNRLWLQNVTVLGGLDARGGDQGDSLNWSNTDVAGPVRLNAGRSGLGAVSLIGCDLGDRFSAVLGDDGDSVSFHMTNVEDDVRLMLGRGSNHFMTDGVAHFAALFIDASTGYDDLTIEDLTTTRDVRLRVASGENTIDVGAATIAGDLFIKTGDDHDEITFTNVQVTGTTTIQHGAGGDVVPP